MIRASRGVASGAWYFRSSSCTSVAPAPPVSAGPPTRLTSRHLWVATALVSVTAASMAPRCTRPGGTSTPVKVMAKEIS
uniref:Uncharacterized protein n=1 Tax=Hordeum vulgare subsp. vulgare TaxID=112509 RepID=A0A8I6Y673_HORVV